MRRLTGISLAFVVLLAATARSAAPGTAPEVLVARAASSYGKIGFDRPAEDAALRDLAAALRQDPDNREARSLIAAIQRRREERRREQRQQGQQQLDRNRQNQRRQQGNQPQPQQGQDENRGNRPPGEQQRAGEMSREEALRLLEALDEQEKRPGQRIPTRDGRSQGPRW